MERLGLPHENVGFGTVGVDLFFVISGFVMVYTTDTKPIGSLEFLRHRIVRVVPLYWLVTIAVFALAAFAPSLVGATDGSYAALLKSLLFIPYWKSKGVAQPVLFLGWTLNYEMFFYVIFAASLAISRTNVRVVAVCLVLAGMVVLLNLFGGESVYAKFYGAAIVLEFAMGMLVAVIFRRGLPISTPVALACFAFGLLVSISQDFIFPGHRTLLAGTASAVMLASALSLEAKGVVMSYAVVQLLGAASYSLYLTHPFVTQAGVKIVAQVRVLESPPAVIAAIALLLVAAGVVAVIIHLAIERPITRYLRGLLQDSRRSDNSRHTN